MFHGFNPGGSSGNSYEINYEDEQFKQVESQKNDAISNIEQVYSGMAEQSDGFYQNQIDATKEWEQKQSELQQEQTDFAIEQIEQQKEQAQKDYTKEQSGAYVDWQKQSNQFGAEAEAQAAQGMQNSGYSESSQTAMYNTYQNRVAMARETVTRVIQEFDNKMTEARLQNNAALAEIAFNSMQKQLELALQGFQFKNQLILDLTNKKLEVDQMYYERWHDVLEQMNTEKALAEQIRQFNESMALEREQFEWQKAQAGGGRSGGGSGGGSGSKNYDYDSDGLLEFDEWLSKAEDSGLSADAAAKIVANQSIWERNS